jgi:Reverse transcriptase (RNA-dependent DNA polymerase)
MTFRHLMHRIFFALPFCFLYLDDLLVASCSIEEHHHHLRQAMQRLQNGLVINREKCVFGQQVVEFLGHKVSGACIL